MSLPTGARIGVYEITGALGAGGMGEVYRARDTRLDRDVAIKVLPSLVASDADRLARFEREAKTLAALNHPNIAHVYDAGRVRQDQAAGPGDSDIAFLAMELVEGEDLSQVIARGKLSVTDTLPIARQIADAIEAAHEQGIVHRDLKPANVKVRRDGTVKVLDFGLAKAITPDPASGAANAQNSPTLTAAAFAPGTQLGVILGTAAYMAPEQAKGKPVDKRADIWAFGVVLYEMLTGRGLFECETVPETLAHVMTREPDLSALPPDTPRRVRELVARCLVKDPRQRLRDIGDARITLEKTLTGAPEEFAPAPVAVASAPPRRGSYVWPAAALVATAAAIWLAVFPLGKTAPTPSSLQFSIAPPAGITTAGLPMKISPDGSKIAYGGLQGTSRKIFIHSLDTGTHAPLTGSEDSVPAVFAWSPDSREFAYASSDGKIRRVPLQGGPSGIIATLPKEQVFTGSWGPGGTFILSPSGGENAGGVNTVMKVTPTGTLEPATTLDASRNESRHSFAAFLPDGRHFTFLATGVGSASRQAHIGSLDSPVERRPLPGIHSRVEYSPTGHLLFLTEGSLMAQPFDLDRLELGGSPEVLVQGLANDAAPNGPYFVSSTGTLVYRPGLGRISQLVWFDRQGKELARVGTPGEFGDIELSPDNRYVAYETPNAGDIWVLDLTTGVPQRVTSDPGRDADPVWSPDGKTIAYRAAKNGGRIFSRAFGIVGEEKALRPSESRESPVAWAKDNKYLVYESQGGLFALPLVGQPTPIRLTPEGSNTFQAGQISPDGKWIAYNSNELGPAEIFVQAFPGPGARLRVSSGGGTMPRWSHDGRELFYISARRFLNAVKVDTAGGTLNVSAPMELFRAIAGAGEQDYAVASDGRFLVNLPSGENSDPPIMVILNWRGKR